MTRTPAQVQLENGVLHVSGEVRSDTVVALRKQGEQLIASAGTDLQVDLGGLEEAHSVVLSMLLCWQRFAAGRGIRLTYQGVSKRLASLAALSNLGDQLTGFGSGYLHPSS